MKIYKLLALDKTTLARLENFKRDPIYPKYYEQKGESMKNKYDNETDPAKKHEIQAKRTFFVK